MKAPTLKEQGYLPKRYLIAIMAFLGMVFNYMLRVNINLTLMAMVKSDNYSNGSTSAQDVCGFGEDHNNTSGYEKGEFDWDEWTQSLITGSFFWGYIWTQIPGGRLAEVLGARRVFGGAIFCASVFTFFIPIAARHSATTLIVVRVLLGISEGATFPSTHALLAAWAPPLERSMISTIIYAGSQAGTIVTFPLAAATIGWVGWEAVFYTQGAMALVWCLAWFLLVSDKPDHDPSISRAERNYINAALGDNKEKKSLPVPLRSVLRSLPFWAILVANTGHTWGFYTLLTDLPLYMKKMLQEDINSNAMLSGMPYLGMWVFSLIVSLVADSLQQRGLVTTQTVRKVATVTGHAGPAVCLLLLTLVECDRSATIALLFISVSLQGSVYTGFLVNHVDIAPNFAGTLFGITNTFGTIPGWAAPLTVGALTSNQQTFGQWRKVFYIAAGIFLVDTIFYVIFASGRVQKWNQVTEAQMEEDKAKVDSPKAEQSHVRSVTKEVASDTLRAKAYDIYVINPYFKR